MTRLDLETLLKLWMYFVTKPQWTASTAFKNHDFTNADTQNVIAGKLNIDIKVVEAFAKLATSKHKSFDDVRNAFHALSQDIGDPGSYSDQFCPRLPDDLG